MNKRRFIALIGALFLPVLFVISIVLFFTGSQYATVFLVISFAASLGILPLLYLLTKFPRDIADIYANISDAIRSAEESADPGKNEQ